METETPLLFWPPGTQEDPGGLGHGPGLAAVPGPARLHARARLPRRERPGVLPGPPGGGSARHDQRVSAWKRMGVLWMINALFFRGRRLRLQAL